MEKEENAGKFLAFNVDKSLHSFCGKCLTLYTWTKFYTCGNLEAFAHNKKT